jgi:hypothetical protein
MRALLLQLVAAVLVANLFAPGAAPVVVIDVLAVAILVVASSALANGEG